MRFLHFSGDAGKMTLIRLYAGQKEVVGDGERKGMKGRRGEEVLRAMGLFHLEADKMSLNPHHDGAV